MTRTFILKVTAVVLVVAAVLGGGLLGLRTEPAAVAAPVPKEDKVKPEEVSDDCLVMIQLALVQRELKLSAETRVKLIDGFDKLDEEAEQVGPSVPRTMDDPPPPAVEHWKKIVALRRQLVADSLTRSQVNRVRQIGVQVLGLYALNAPWVADELALAADQKKEVVKVLKAMQQEQYDRQAMTQMMLPRAETQADYYGKCDEKLADLLTSLSASQQRKWKELAGEKVGFDRKRAVPYFYELFAKYTPKADPRPGLKGTGPANDDDSRELPPPLLPAGPQPALPPVPPAALPGGAGPPAPGTLPPPPTFPAAPPVRR
jgi:hypothetical protein